MRPLEELVGTLLERWEHRYGFSLDRLEGTLRFTVPGFALLAEEGEDLLILRFEEAGEKHIVKCPWDDAPRLIEALLFPSTN